MAKTARRAKGIQRPDSEASPDENTEHSAQVFEGMADSRVAIYRKDDYTKKPVFHGYVSTHEATEAKVNELFGGGDYRLQLRAPDEMGREIIKQSRDFRLPGAYKPPTGALPGIPQTATVATPSAATITTPDGTQVTKEGVREMLDMAMLSKVMDIMKTTKSEDGGNTQMFALIMENQRQAAEANRTFMLNMAQQNQAMMTLMLEVMKTRSGEGIDLKDVLPLIAEKSASTPVGELIKGLRELKGLASDEPEGTGDPILDSVPKVVEMFGTFIHNRQGGAAPVATPNPRGLSAGEPQPQQERLPMWAQLLRGQRGPLLSFASRGSDPEWTAGAALQLMPEQYIGILKEFLAMPEHVGLATQVIPELGNFPQWTQKFFAALASELSDDTEEDTPDGDVVGGIGGDEG